MSAAEEDTELRDLLIQNLENSGVLGKIKAEMRAAVFLAMEEQERLQNKTPLINDNLKKCLNSSDGRLVAGLIVDFLQVFNLDFSLSVFQPEINSLSGVDSRDLVCRDLGLSESDLNKNCPLLLELVRRGRHKDRPPGGTPEGTKRGHIPQDLSQKQIALARTKFDCYKDLGDLVLKEDLKRVFTDLFPSLNKNMMESFISNELQAADRSFSKTVDFQLFLLMYRRLFSQCRSVVVPDSDVCPQEERSRAVSKDTSSQCKGDSLTRTSSSSSAFSPGGARKERHDVDLESDDAPDEGDSFFDDPLPPPQKIYGCPAPLREDSGSGPLVSPMRRGQSLNDLSLLPASLEVGPDDVSCELRKVETPGARGSPAGGGAGSSLSVPSHSNNGTPDPGEGGPRAPADRTGSLHLDEDVEYDDDFISHRSDLSRSELSIGEEIQEVSIEGPEPSEKLDEITEDLSVSQISQSHGVDYMEEVP